MSPSHYPHVRVSGAPSERGRQYGRQAAERVHRSVALYTQIFRSWAQLEWPDVRRLARSYEECILAFDERYVAEMKGIAAGSEVDYEDILAINVRTEVMFAAKAALAEGRPAITAPGECTSLAVLPSATADGRILVGQNWDWFVEAGESVVVLECEPEDGPRFVTVVEAGLLAKFGFNSAGVGVLTNALVSDADRGEPAVPYHVALRSLHEATGLTDALCRLQAAVRASSANYLVSHEDGLALNVEAAPGDFSRLFIMQPSDGLVVHTNHFISPRFPLCDVGVWVMPDSPLRLQSAGEFMKPRLGTVSPLTLQEALSQHADHPYGVCSHPDETPGAERHATIASGVMDLRTRQLWLADGNPCERGYQRLDYSEFLAP